MSASVAGLSLVDIIAALGGRLQGEGGYRVVQVGTLEAAGPQEISFLANRKYAAKLAATRAGAVILDEASAAGFAGNAIIAPAPYEYFARVAQLFNPRVVPSPGIHPTAVVESLVPDSVSIGPHAVIGPDVRLGEGVVIGAGVVVGQGASIGAGSWLYPRVTVYE
ncbi:MAG: UDP-3-O-(3-hydroxymyristoyl)glucosamine N-acyltransferase, partial [Pseudomonadota bacterium]